MQLEFEPRILIVEDEPITALDLSERLSKSGFLVIGKVSTGEKAYELALKDKPDIVLMDVKLEGDTDGIKAAEKIKKDLDIPTIFLTAFPEEGSFERAKSAEPYGYIIKPYDERELISTLQMALFRRSTEKEIKRLNRLYLFISQVNQSIVRVNSEGELFSKICEIAVNLGGYKLAWIGLIERATQNVTPVAVAGDADGYLDKLKINLKDRVYGSGLTAIAIKNKKPFITHDYLCDEMLKPWWGLASKKGFRAAAAFPLFIKNEVCGALMLYSDDKECFNKAEIKLLEEVTADVSFALSSFNEAKTRERIFTLTPDILTIVRSDGSIREVNPSWENILGWLRDETIDKPLINFVEKNSAESFLKILNNLFKGKSVPVVELPFKTAGGSTRILSWNFLPATDGEFIVGVARDVTDKTLAEKRIHEINAIYTSLVENLQQAVFQKDASGKYVFANARFCEMAGISLNELIGKRDIEIFIPPVAEKYQRHDDTVVKTGSNITYDEQITTSDGKHHCIRVTKTPVKNLEGQIDRIQGIIYDITKDVETTKLLNLQAAALEVAETAIVVTDVHGKIIWVNKAVEKLTQYTVDELIGQHASIFRSGVHDDKFFKELWNTILEGKIWKGEIINKRKDGSLFPVELTITPIKDINGKIEYFVSIQNDISFKKELEAQLHRNYRLQSVTTLVAAMAHDLNNALTPIVMAVSLLRDEYTSETAEPLYDMILKSVDRSATFLKEVLAATRGVKLSTQIVDVSDIIQNTIQLVQEFLPEEITIKVNIPEGTWKVNGDPGQLQQVFNNLILNARDAMPEGGVIKITAGNYETDVDFIKKHITARPGKYLRIEVSDNGKGIHPEHLERIFDPFFTTKEFGQGFGLGLTVAQSIIRSHNGIIDVESVLNKGTTFRIYLPADVRE